MAWNEPGGSGSGNDKDKDPWGGGNRGDQGPPDLDEVLRKLQEKINGIFGGKGSGGKGGKGGGGTPGLSAGLLVLIGVVVLAIWGVTGFYTVNEQERVVVLRLGKYHDTVQPGLRWNPPLVDQLYSVNVTQVRTLDHRALMLTEDENIVEVGLKIQYKLSDPKSYVLNVREPEASLAHSTGSALRHVVGTSEMHTIMTEGRAILGADVQERVQRYMDDYGTGLSISKVNVEMAQAPSQVQPAFDDVIKAREDEQRVKNEAETYANGIIPEARGHAQRQLEEANAYREEVLARAEGESKRFTKLLVEYEKAPKVTRERLYLDAMESVLGQSTKVLMDVEGGNNIMYLPLDKLVERSAADQRSQQRLDDVGVQEVTNQVIDRLRRRQEVKREGR